MNKIRNLFLVLTLFLSINSCEKNQVEEVTSQKNDELTVEQAKAFIEVQRMNTFTLKSGNIIKQTVKIRADWGKAKNSSNENVSVIETEIQAQGGFGFATQESMQAWSSTKDDNYLSSLSRLVVIKYKKTGEVFSFIMSVVAEKSYFESKHFKLWDNTYLKRDKDFTGYVLFHHLSGEFANGWIYCEGQITNSIFNPENLDLPIDLKSAKMTVSIYQWIQECTDWWTVTTCGDVTNITHRVSCKDVYTYVGSYTVGGIDPNNGSGAYTPTSAQPCNCDICPICGGCIDLLKSAALPTEGSTTTTTSTPCPVCNGHAAPQLDPNKPCSGDPIKNPAICPTNTGRVIGGTFGCVRVVTDEPNCDEPPYNKLHRGVDISAAYGSDLYAMAGGVLTIHNEPSGLGLYANIHTPSGTDYVYGHLDEINIQNGKTVKIGDIIGKTGSSGNAGGTPPHVHISIKENGLYIDPISYFATGFGSDGSLSSPCNN